MSDYIAEALENLRAKRDQINACIAAIENLDTPCQAPVAPARDPKPASKPVRTTSRTCRPHEHDDRIVTFLRAQKKSMRLAAIGVGAKIPEGSVFAVLARLVAAGRIIKHGLEYSAPAPKEAGARASSSAATP